MITISHHPKDQRGKEEEIKHRPKVLFETSSGRFLVRIMEPGLSTVQTRYATRDAGFFLRLQPFWIRNGMTVPDLPYKETVRIPFWYVRVGTEYVRLQNMSLLSRRPA